MDTYRYRYFSDPNSLLSTGILREAVTAEAVRARFQGYSYL